MKKILLTLALLVLLAPMAHAATFASDYGNRLSLNETKELAPMTITATAADEITAQYGMDIVLDPDNKTLWDAVPSLTATGTAVDDQSISANLVPTYKNNYQILHIPVLSNFKAGDLVILNGIRLRAYKHAFNNRFLQLDLNGDGMADAVDINKTEVQDVISTDFTPPYPMTNVTATLSADLKSVTLSWQNPPDYDFIGSDLDRTRIRDGNALGTSLFNNQPMTTFVDTDIQPGDTLTYSLYGGDRTNFSTPVVKTIEVNASSVPVVPTTPTTPVTPTAPSTPPTPVVSPTGAQADELKLLNSLFSYYKVREAIKCRIGIPASDSDCLWAKIDLVYAQALLGRSDVKLSLSATELGWIKSRIVWPEKRYQTECVEAATPDKSCPALQKSIKRAHYFIDQP